ncbi:hypothetical protein V8J82_19930 [Gymnodinialimonas sp. 2305UL16-5]|uniref:hypothetical protein n=1 Tax=Gymnodinialimonas mytili TaxID=3126503 RepID=UPI0030AB8B82
MEQEAGPAKLAQVSSFMEHVVQRGKGGGGGPRNDEIGASDFLEVTLPFRQAGTIQLRKFLIGWYVGQLRDVTGNLDNDEDAQLNEFRNEMYAEPIRRALATW